MDYGLHDQHASYILSQSNRDDEEETDLDASWVMLSRDGEIEPLPHESILHKTRGRIALSITAPAQPPDIVALNIRSDNGIAYITNQRVIYLPSNPTEQFKSFSSKILGCQDGRMRSSWVGPWYWEASVRPVPDGNVSTRESRGSLIPPDYPLVTLRLTFKDGGFSEFESKFVELKQRLHHAAQVAEESGQRNWALTVHDEQLPEYSAAQSQGASPSRAQPPNTSEGARERAQSTPDEPPPDYDEAQAQAVSMQLDERLRSEAERR
ncbi:hypothetical protein F5Y16DRAFT_420936 [Xylariaceae sp. FL0255]|nr:hypothetical protein F5Y16DRAFT_420936 [Xylariaceae sp. FL0255]